MFFEYLNVLVRVVTVPLGGVALLDGTHECPEFPGYYPVKVTIFDSFVELIFLDLELFKVIPAYFDGKL